MTQVSSLSQYAQFLHAEMHTKTSTRTLAAKCIGFVDRLLAHLTERTMPTGVNNVHGQEETIKATNT